MSNQCVMGNNRRWPGCIESREDWRLRRLVWVAVVIVLVWAGSASALCGTVNIGHMSWHASRVVAEIQARFLEAAFECIVTKVEMIEQPVLPLLLERGQPDVVVGVWLHEITGEAREAVIDGRLVPLGDLFAGGSREGWWVPEYFASSYGDVETVNDVNRNYEFFIEAGYEKATFHNCPANWACSVVNDNLFAAYGLGENFNNVHAESGEALRQSIERAARLEMPWFGYYWAPNALMGKYPMRMVGMNDLDAKGFRCNAKENCEEPHAGAYPLWRVLSIARQPFVDSHPAEVDVLRQISIPEAVMNGLLLRFESDLESVETVVDAFLEDHAELWSAWVAEGMIDRVVASVNNR